MRLDVSPHAATLETYSIYREVSGIPVDNSSMGDRAAILESIEEFARFELDWDGYGGLPISDVICENAKSTLAAFPAGLPVPDVSPNPNGTISFDWLALTGAAYLEIGKTRFSFYIKPIGSDPILLDGFVQATHGIGQAVLSCLYAPSIPPVSLVVISVERFGHASRR